MSKKESADLALLRWEELEALQKHYPEFTDFLYDGITELMGFQCTAVQLDIAAFMQHHPNPFKQVQAQRSQAKTTIAAFFAVFLMIHDPKSRTLIFSAASGMSSEISGWIIQIIMGWDILECMRPDRQAGDRAGIDAFDIHHSLKGPEKSPSVACLGIESSMQGRRADLVIADDIESSKNSRTPVQRDKLLHYTKDFSSICQNGAILYLGTPQSGDSIYNSLPGRNFEVRIWPGRYPTPEELPGYGGKLAPMILERIEEDPSLQTGGGAAFNRGKPTDPELLGEAKLVEKEIDQGPSYFQLQHMLCTELTDKERYPLKIQDLLVYPLDREEVPGKFRWAAVPENRVDHVPQSAITDEYFYRASADTSEYFKYTKKIMYVDPAGGGQNGDETAFVILYYCNGYIFVMDIGATKGGWSEQGFAHLSDAYNAWDCGTAYVEKNFGHGALAAMWKQHDKLVNIEDDMVTGQKEVRICNVLEPVMAAHKIVVNESVLKTDVQLCADRPSQHRSVYQLFFQLQKITRDKDALIHDDRLDALSGGVKVLMDLMAINADVAINRVQKERYEAMMLDPLGTGINAFNRNNTLSKNMLDRYKRR